MSVLLAAVLFAVVVWYTRYVSLGSICAAVLVPLRVLLHQMLIYPVIDFVPIFAALCATSALIVVRHADNIKRLTAGTENKFGAAK